MERSRVAQRIRAFRKLKGYTQTDLARLTGISIGILGAVERGTRVPDEELIDKVARVLEIDRSELE